MILDEVHVILNDAIEERFKAAEETMHKQLHGLAELRDDSQSETQQHFLNHMLTSTNLVPKRNSNAISVWHGAAPSKLDSISWYGMLNLSSTDPGIYIPSLSLLCTSLFFYSSFPSSLLFFPPFFSHPNLFPRLLWQRNVLYTAPKVWRVLCTNEPEKK